MCRKNLEMRKFYSLLQYKNFDLMIILTQMFGVLMVGMGGMKKAVCTHPESSAFKNNSVCKYFLL